MSIMRLRELKYGREMNDIPPELWQQLLQDTDLRATSKVINQLEVLIGDEGTTPKQLADTILQDIALTSRVLLVANSIIHNRTESPLSGGSLTQAIVRIGFNGLRAICISVAMMDSFIKKSAHADELKVAIEQSFNVAVHARTVARRTGADEEEVFIAGLFQNLGELLFWSSSIPDNPLYKDLLEYAVDTPEQAFKKLTGKDFQDMSQALAKEWKLSDLLLQTFDVEMNANTKAVHLGRRLSLASQTGWDSPQTKLLLQEHLNTLGVDLITGMRFIREGEAEAKALAASYVSEAVVEPTQIEPAQAESSLDELAPIEPAQVESEEIDEDLKMKLAMLEPIVAEAQEPEKPAEKPKSVKKTKKPKSTPLIRP